MVTTVISTVDVQNDFVLTLNSGDGLIVAKDAGMYWTGASSATAAVGSYFINVSIYGVVDLVNFSIGRNSAIFVGADGSISADTGLSIGDSQDAFAGQSNLENHGIISSVFSTALYVKGSSNTVINFGVISAGSYGVILGFDFGSFNNLANYGRIVGIGQTAISMDGGNSSVQNFGSISGYYGLVVNGEFNGSTYSAVSQSIDNSGAIEGQEYGILNALFLVNSTLSIFNSGTITGNYAIIGGNAREIITNTGTINGAVVLEGGNDIFDSLGGIINGAVYGGEGLDTYYTDDASLSIVEFNTEVDTVNAAVGFRLAAFVENLNLLGTGNFNGFGNSGVNVINGNAGDNRLLGLYGNDTLNGDLGDDRLVGGALNDSLDGGDGNDALFGGLGSDTLRGGDGDDILNGGASRDILAGGTGADTFVFSALAHTANTQTTGDQITDFIKGDDLIDVKAIDANSTNAASNDTFTFIGAAAFSLVAGQLRFVQSGGNTYVEMDVNGDNAVDAMIRINGLLTLNASDFLL